MTAVTPTHTKLTIYLPVALKKKLKKQSDLTHKSVSQIIVEKLDDTQKPNKFLKYLKMGDNAAGEMLEKQIEINRKDYLPKKNEDIF